MFSPDMHDEVHRHLSQIDKAPITKVQFNQLLVVSQAGSVSDGFFQYYWKECPEHTYDVKKLDYFDQKFVDHPGHVIQSHDHLRWGLYRIFVDGLLYFGNVIAGFDCLRSCSVKRVRRFFNRKRFDTEAIAERGPALGLQNIAKDDRYLISEMACKTFGEVPDDAEHVKKMLREELERHLAQGGKKISFRELLQRIGDREQNEAQLFLSFDDVLERELNDTKDLLGHFDQVFKKFALAREKATQNTDLYLSMINDLDIYVATSMRTRDNFRQMATACENIFGDARVEHLHLRYFDPTMSAAQGHEDKGLIECLMVKCSKVLIYCEGEKESYGKDAEAAMALSMGKPVIFYCDHGKRTNFYRDVHPLARLIDFRSGVAVGAIVTDEVKEVAELLKRIFENKMEYRIEHHPKRPGYLKLFECLTDSVVRLQTDDNLLTSTFWNNYHNRRPEKYVSLAAGKQAERLME